MKRSGIADLPVYGGAIPSWLFERMTKLSLAVVESIVQHYGQREFLRRLSDPFWFQSFGAVIGMDWNSSGVTTAVMSALKQSLNAHSRDLGLYVCGGKGKHSLKTPAELLEVGSRTGLDGNALARYSKLSAKVDNTALQDGFQLYLHSFVVSANGDWSVIQQGLKSESGSQDKAFARRYHWNSDAITSFVEEPHTAICGEHQGEILNLVDKRAVPTQQAIMGITAEHPDTMLREIRHLQMPTHKDIRKENIDLKRLGTVLWLAHEQEISSFEDVLLLKGVGPRTIQSLALVSEVIHGTPSRFSDPARFSFAHGGKGARPFAVPTTVYDETISTLQTAVERAKLGESDKHAALKKLTNIAQKAEQTFVPDDFFEEAIQRERDNSWKYGGRTVSGFVPKPSQKTLKSSAKPSNQLSFF